MPPAAAMKPSARSKACATVPSTWLVSASNSSGSSSIPLIIATITGFSQYIEPAGKARSSSGSRRILEPAQQPGDGAAVRAPPFLGAVVLAVGDPDRRDRLGEEAREERLQPLGGQDSAHQVAAPVVAVGAVRRALGVDLADRRVAVEQPAVQEVHEGQDVAAAVREAEAARLREARPDPLDHRVGLIAAVGQREEQVGVGAGGGQHLGDLVPEVVVEEVGDDGVGAGAAAPAGGEARHVLGGGDHHLRQLLGDPPLAVADLDPVQEGRDAGAAHVRVVVQVEDRREVRVRPERLALADRHVVADREAAEERAQPRVVVAVEDRIEPAALADLADVGARPAVREQEADDLGKLVHRSSTPAALVHVSASLRPPPGSNPREPGRDQRQSRSPGDPPGRALRRTGAAC